MKVPFRQVHLDFHTSPYITDVGIDFEPNEFVTRLKKSDVNSITVFAKCHHGYSYYPTKVGTKHPSLQIDLLGEMIESCHRAGIRVPVYTTVVWDEVAAENNAWVQINREGQIVGKTPLSNDNNSESRGWKWLCMNSPYVDYLEEHTREFVSNYEVDGVFFDIIFQTRPGCVCPHCIKSMKSLGLNPQKDSDLLQHSLYIERKLMRRMNELVHSIKPGLPTFFNGRIRLDGDPEQGVRPELKELSHIEIESLPSGFWGYNHFPLYAAYYKTLDKEFVGMTGKFHKMWGDFGSLKNQAALEFECFQMLAYGGKCSIGDQLHPRGALDPATYELIGTVYSQVKAKEPWCEDTNAIDEIGILTSMNSHGVANTPSSESDEGAMRILMELHRPFRVLDGESDFSKVRLIIAPDSVSFNEIMKRRIITFLEQGGALILSHQSGLDASGDFALDIGLKYEGDLEYSPDFVTLGNGIDTNLNAMPYVVYEKGSKVSPSGPVEVFGKVWKPYYNRNWEYYMSHFHFPVDSETGDPAIVKKGKIIYLSHPLFKLYRNHGNQVYKQIIANSINLLLPNPLVETNLPSTAQLSIQEQPESNRIIIHILHYIHQRRTPTLDIIEDIIPLHNIMLKIMTNKKPGKVYLAPSCENLSFDYIEGCVTTTIPSIHGHAMIVVE